MVCIYKAWTRAAQEEAKEGEEIFISKMDEEMIKRTTKSMEMDIKALPKEEKTWDQIVPKHYHKWNKVFLEEEISPTSTLGYCDRPGQRCPEDTGLQNISAHTLGTGKTQRLYLRKPRERIYSTLALPVLVTLFLCWEKGWEVPTSGRLQEAKFIYGARSIPPSPYPGTSG